MIICYGKPLVDWLEERLGITDSGAVAIGVAEEDRLLAVIGYRDYNGSNMEMMVASVDPRWCSRMVLREAFRHPFETVGCNRVSSVVASHNAKALKLAQRLGFSVEGYHPKGMPDGSDAISLGLLREDCKWIGDHVGQKVSTKAA